MEPEELLKPRFEVIADYPNSPYKIGDIAKQNEFSTLIHLTSINTRNEFGEDVITESLVSPERLESYPALFKKLT